MRKILSLILLLMLSIGALSQTPLTVSTADDGVKFRGVEEIQFPANQVRIVGRKAIVFSLYGLTPSDIPSLDASKIGSGIFAPARLGSGTADSTTCLRGDSTWTTCSAAGEANTASNVGSGAGWFKQKSGVDLQFKSFIVSSKFSLTSNTNDLTLDLNATTSDIPEGSNLYYTTGRFDSRFALKTTSDLTEGLNLYFTNARVDSEFDTRLATKTTTNLAEGSNLYFTNARARGAISASGPISYNSATGVLSFSPSQLTIGTGSTSDVNSLTKIISTDSSDARMGAVVNNRGAFLRYNSSGDFADLYAYDYTNFVAKNLSLNEFGGNVGVGTAAPSVLLDINSDKLRLRTAHTPSSSSEACDAGTIAWDSSYVYVCVSANTWKRSALSSW